jgi:uncharacterized protein (DUF433 family)
MELDWREHIHSDTKVLMGKPVIKNSRISVELILELYSEGWSSQQLLESYPGLSMNDLRAVFLYLKECLGQELYFPINKAV